MRKLLSAIIFLLAVAASLPGQPRYRIAAMGSGEWMDPKAADKLHARIDDIAADGYNVISVGSFYFMPQYFVNFTGTPYPEAAVHTPDKVRKNTETFRDNIRYAKSRGIEYVVSRSNSHYVPYPYWMAHQDELNPGGAYTPLLEKAHQNDMFEKAKKGKSPNCVPHQQWENPCFRDFFLWSTRQALKAVPELDGFLNAYAEAAWAFDGGKIASHDWKKWKDCIDYDRTDSCFVDYLNSLYRILHEERGGKVFFAVRDWYLKPEILASLQFPKDDLQISVKYAGFDQPLVNFPPWAMDLKKMGLEVSLDIHVYDAEYPNPVYWYDNGIVNRMCSNIIEAGFEGVTNQDYILRGEDKADNPIRRLTQLTFAQAIQGKPFTDAQALSFLKKTYGKASSDVLASLKAVAKAQETTVKMFPSWFWRGDGLSVGGTQPFGLWQLFDNPEAPDRMGFVRQDVMGIPEYVAERLAGKDDKQILSECRAAGRLTPDDVISILEDESARAVTLIEAARRKAPGADRMKELHASAYINRALCKRNMNLIKAARYYYLSGYVYDNKYQKNSKRVADTPFHYEKECAACLEEYIRQDYLMRRLMKDYAPRRRTLRHENTYYQERTVAKSMGLEIKTADESAAEFERISKILD